MVKEDTRTFRIETLLTIMVLLLCGILLELSWTTSSPFNPLSYYGSLAVLLAVLGRFSVK